MYEAQIANSINRTSFNRVDWFTNYVYLFIFPSKENKKMEREISLL